MKNQNLQQPVVGGRPVHRNVFVSNMMRTLILLTMMVMGGSNAWGQTSYGKAEISAAPGSTTDWQCITDQGNVKAWYKGTSNEGDHKGGVEIDSKWFVKLSSEGFIKIRVAKNTVAIGDILKVEVAKFYNDSKAADLGFAVVGSNGTVSENVSDRNIYTLEYTLKAGDINNDPEAPDYDYIQINRNYNTGCAYHSVEILRNTSYSVAFAPNYADRGTVSATVGGVAITSGQKVVSGTEVTFRATPNSGYRVWQWATSPATYGETTNVTVTSDVSVTHNFTQGITLNAYVRNGGGSVVVVNGSNQGNTLTVNPWPGIATFKATPNAGYMLEGWYTNVDCTQRVQAVDGKIVIDGNNVIYNSDYLSTDGMTINLWANLVEIPKKTIGRPYCNHAPGHDNGDNYFAIGQLNEGTGVTIANASTGRDVTVPATGGNMSFVFDNTYNLSDLSAWTISDNADLQARVNSVEFIGGDDGKTSLVTCYTDAGNRGKSNGTTAVDAELQAKLKKVKEIRIHFKNGEQQTYYFTWIRFSFTHADRIKPVLSEGTATDMRVQEGENLILANGSGFWRQCTDDTYANVKSDGLIPTNEWKQRYEIPSSSLTVNSDYYFRVKDEMTCGLDYTHTSEVVNVHAKVVPAIKRVTVNGTERQYDVYAPTGLTSSESSKVGVVISLHGASNDWWNGRVDFNGIAEQEKNVENKKFVVVYPRGIMRQLRGTERGWESYTESNTEDVEFFKAIVTELKKTYTVDDSRIYLAGFSNGGMMAYKAAHQAGDFFAAFASVGGFPVNESHLFHAGKQPTPFIHIHGADDTVISADAYKANTIVHNMIYRNGASFANCGEGDGIITTNPKVTKDCHKAEAGGADYYYYKVTGLAHWYWNDWTDNGQDDIAPALWAFFNKADKVKDLSNEKPGVDKTLKFRVNDETNFWDYIVNNRVGDLGFYNVNSGTNVLTYGGHTKTNDNKNVWHSLQFVGGPHYLKLNMQTNTSDTEHSKFFMVTLTKTGSTTPIFSRRYQAGQGKKDLYINFNALDGFNEYKLNIIKSSSDLTVQVHNVEFHSGYCEDVNATENPTAFYGVDEVLSGMNPIYQPVYGISYDGIAKEYLPIADLQVGTQIADNNGKFQVDGVDKTSIATSTTTDGGKLFVNLATSGKDGENTSHKSKNAYIIGTAYNIDNEKGINISKDGRAMMPEYLNGTRIAFPNNGVIAIKVQGTVDFTLLASSKYATDENRRTLKVYYTNDQLDGELKELEEWWFYGTRTEMSTYPLSPLSVNVRLPQLGQDGTCTLFITYEGNGRGQSFEHVDADNDEIWIQGFVIKRPDLKVTIGRTDKLYYNDVEEGGETVSKPINDNSKLTCFGENKPYQWNFGTAGFNNTKKADIDKKKVNKYDGRTYICGVGPNGEKLIDHLLVYSDGQGQNENNKAQFDGRPSNGKHVGYEDDPTDNNEHIEFLHPTKYSGNNAIGTNQNGFDADRRSFTPILSDGLKVNVTGSGWFTIACAAPNGPVNMKVLSSTNGGVTYINLLREFIVEKSSSDTDWKTFKVYLKAHAEKDGDKGFWDGNLKDGQIDPELTQMSLYVVFDKIDGESYDDSDAETSTDDAQLNIHFLQWINEMPADYVFQREEDPALLNSLQKIVGGGTAAKPDLYWQAGTSLVEAKTTSTPAYGSVTSVDFDSAYGSASQQDRQNGQTSGWGKVSADLGCMWNVAAKAHTIAHTEVDYANGNKNYAGFNHAYDHAIAISNDGANSSKNLEFAIPISGSFFRFMPMKNQFISAYIVPTDGTKVLVLDETGKPIPFLSGADTNGDTNKAKITPEGRMHGWVHAVSGMTYDDTHKYFTPNANTAVRIDFAALAGKEYFIVSNDGMISLARLQASGNAWRANMEEVSTPLTLTDGGTGNTTAIASSMSGTGRYVKSVTLSGRTFNEGKWAPIVLPFSLNEKKLEEVFGEGTECLHFTDVEKATNTIKFTHHFYNMIVAGRPVFIRPAKTVSNPEFTDVTLQAGAVINSTPYNGFQFFATYDGATIENYDLYMNTNNGINYLLIDAGSMTYPGMRAFIKNTEHYDFSETPNPSSTKALFLNFYDEGIKDITGIEELVSAELGEKVIIVTKSTKVYDLNGRVVADGSEINRLPAGLYIVNGKKYVVK